MSSNWPLLAAAGVGFFAVGCFCGHLISSSRWRRALLELQAWHEENAGGAGGRNSGKGGKGGALLELDSMAREFEDFKMVRVPCVCRGCAGGAERLEDGQGQDWRAVRSRNARPVQETRQESAHSLAKVGRERAGEGGGEGGLRGGAHHSAGQGEEVWSPNARHYRRRQNTDRAKFKDSHGHHRGTKRSAQSSTVFLICFSLLSPLSSPSPSLSYTLPSSPPLSPPLPPSPSLALPRPPSPTAFTFVCAQVRST
ncbi:unnamed protein product [Closterium sp. Naga37s-1]|nr:unnamed protein product [Closterium sp. Naga37s-1]